MALRKAALMHHIHCPVRFREYSETDPMLDVDQSIAFWSCLAVALDALVRKLSGESWSCIEPLTCEAIGLGYGSMAG